MRFKLISFTGILLIVCSLSIHADEKLPTDKEKQEKDNSKKITVFDSCGKSDVNKCKPEKKILFTDTSKYIK